MAERAAAAMAERVAHAERAAPPVSSQSDRLPAPASEKPTASWSAAAAAAPPPPGAAPSGAGISAREHDEIERLRAALGAAQRELAELRKSARDKEVQVQTVGEEMRMYREALERRDEEHRQARLDEEAKRQVPASRRRRHVARPG